MSPSRPPSPNPRADRQLSAQIAFGVFVHFHLDLRPGPAEAPRRRSVGQPLNPVREGCQRTPSGSGHMNWPRPSPQRRRRRDHCSNQERRPGAGKRATCPGGPDVLEHARRARRAECRDAGRTRAAELRGPAGGGLPGLNGGTADTVRSSVVKFVELNGKALYVYHATQAEKDSTILSLIG